jgi:hypothetical protein
LFIVYGTVHDQLQILFQICFLFRSVGQGNGGCSPNTGTNITWLNFCGSARFNISKFCFVITYIEYRGSYIPYGILSTFLVRVTINSGLFRTQHKFTKVSLLTEDLEDLLDVKRREVKASDMSLCHWIVGSRCFKNIKTSGFYYHVLQRHIPERHFQLHRWENLWIQLRIYLAWSSCVAGACFLSFELHC